MRILVFSDLHNDVEHVGRIEGMENASCVIIAGDLTCVGGRKDAERIIKHVKQFNPNVFAVAGNFDKRDVEDYLNENGISLHGNGFIIDDIGIFGLGGSNQTPFNTANELNELEIAQIIQRGYNKVSGAKNKLFISHAPPYNTKADIAIGGRHVGSKAIRAFIDLYKPDICIVGHIHEARSEDKIGVTTLINPGMLRYGGYVEIIKEKEQVNASLKIMEGFK